MSDRIESLDSSYVGSLLGELNATLKCQAKTLTEISTCVEVISVSIINIEKKNTEQDLKLAEYSTRIRNVERNQDKCEAAIQIRGIWYNIKKLNSFMDLYRQKNPDVDTQSLDVNAQRLMHRAEMQNTLDRVLQKGLPWLLIGLLAGVGLITGAIGGLIGYYLNSQGVEDIDK